MALPPRTYGADGTPRGNQPRWCSQKCRMIAFRRARGLWVREDAAPVGCLGCGQMFQQKVGVQKYCTPRCGWLHKSRLRPKDPDWAAGRRRAREYPCKVCGAVVLTRASLVLCELCRAKGTQATNRRKNAKRKGAVVGIRYTLVEIGDRDGWCCHICRKTVNRTLPGTAEHGPTIDHLVPLAAGGHDEPVNVSLAHRSCNVLRRDKGIAQLRLVG